MMKSDSKHEIAQVHEILTRTASSADLLLPTLLEVQRRLRHVPNAAIAVIAQHFNLTRADVYGVTTFYHDLHEAPLGRQLVQICQAEACQAVGCRVLTAHAEQRLGIVIGTTAADASATLEAAYCFGNCACGPTVRIGDHVYGRVTAERFDELIDMHGGAEPRS
jgi:formate dehydrogenase subunit gamma